MRGALPTAVLPAWGTWAISTFGWRLIERFHQLALGQNRKLVRRTLLKAAVEPLIEGRTGGVEGAQALQRARLVSLDLRPAPVIPFAELVSVPQDSSQKTKYTVS